jgi:paraquat-inducible protein A
LLAPLALAAAAGSLAAGLTLPIMHVRSLVIFERSVSILGGIRALLDSGDILLAAILFAFSAAFPAAKILLLLVAWVRARSGRPLSARFLGLLRSAGRWSMLDVFVLALVIFAVKARPLAEVETASALLPFTLAILLTAFAAHRIGRAGG